MKRSVKLYSVLCLLFLMVTQSYADGLDVTSVGSNVNGIMAIVIKFLNAISLSFGIGFLVMGVVKYRKYRQNPLFVRLSEVVATFLFALIFLGLPILSQYMGFAIFSADQKHHVPTIFDKDMDTTNTI